VKGLFSTPDAQKCRLCKDYFDELWRRFGRFAPVSAGLPEDRRRLRAMQQRLSRNSEETQLFIRPYRTGSTSPARKDSAEIVFERADSTCRTWGLPREELPRGKVLKSDVSIAKNYLNEMEVSKLNRLVTMSLTSPSCVP